MFSMRNKKTYLRTVCKIPPYQEFCDELQHVEGFRRERCIISLLFQKFDRLEEVVTVRDISMCSFREIKKLFYNYHQTKHLYLTV